MRRTYKPSVDEAMDLFYNRLPAEYTSERTELRRAMGISNQDMLDRIHEMDPTFSLDSLYRFYKDNQDFRIGKISNADPLALKLARLIDNRIEISTIDIYDEDWEDDENGIPMDHIEIHCNELGTVRKIREFFVENFGEKFVSKINEDPYTFSQFFEIYGYNQPLFPLIKKASVLQPLFHGEVNIIFQ